MEKPKYKQEIRVGRNVTAIMELPCVFSCHKEADGNLVYLLYDWDNDGNYIEARRGDWLCEDTEGRWSVINNNNYKQTKSLKI